MKRLMIAGIAGLCAAVSFGIESANIVGYNSTAIAGGKLSCISLQFADVGTDGDLASIGKLTSTGLTAGKYDTMNTEAPCIMVYNGLGYDYYYYISDAYDADGNEVTAWANGNGDAITGVIAQPGEAFWASSPTAGTLTFSL
jgi:hypothetical protein